MKLTPKIPGGPLVMGIVNVTPDSFSDGGRLVGVEAARDHALGLLRDGADIIDIGGESTRPGAEPVDADAELARVLPVIEAIRQKSDAPISIDTTKPGVARAAMKAGATIWNDVAALRAPGALEAAAGLGCTVVLMHMQGEPRTMQAAPQYDNVIAEVSAFLVARAEAAIAAGVARDKLWIDPGIGFGKTLRHNLLLIDAVPVLKERAGLPLVLGASRKRFIKAIDDTADEATDRLGGSLAAALAGVLQGADMVRVHDVRETVQMFRVWGELEHCS